MSFQEDKSIGYSAVVDGSIACSTVVIGCWGAGYYSDKWRSSRTPRASFEDCLESFVRFTEKSLGDYDLEDMSAVIASTVKEQEFAEEYLGRLGFESTGERNDSDCCLWSIDVPTLFENLNTELQSLGKKPLKCASKHSSHS